MRSFRIVIGVFAVGLAVAGAGMYSALAQDDCVGELECYEIPGEESPGEESPGESGSSGGGGGDADSGGADEPWSGTLDGRLNPQPDEDFSIFCQNDSVNVWASNIEVAGPVATVSLRQIIDLAAGTSFTTEGGMTATKAGDGDTITLTGSPSNNGGVGSKSFSLAACVASNGGEPAAEAAPVEIVENTTPDDTTTEETEETEEEIVEAETEDEFLVRVFRTASSEGASSLEIFWAWIIAVCGPWGLGLMVPPYGYALWRKRRRA